MAVSASNVAFGQLLRETGHAPAGADDPADVSCFSLAVIELQKQRIVDPTVNAAACRQVLEHHPSIPEDRHCSPTLMERCWIARSGEFVVDLPPKCCQLLMAIGTQHVAFGDLCLNASH
jgi:hypothetical protein